MSDSNLPLATRRPSSPFHQDHKHEPRAAVVPALSIFVIWLGGYLLLSRYGVLLLPRAVAEKTSLTLYLFFVQLLATGVGIFWVFGSTRKKRGLREFYFPALGCSSARKNFSWGGGLGHALLLAPVVYLCAHSFAMWCAYDTLLAELAARGSQAVQRQTGELGRSATHDSLWLLGPFMLLVAPVAEELLFRGGIYGAVQSVLPLARQKEASEGARGSSREPSLMEIPGLRRSRWGWGGRLPALLSNGGAAVLLSTAIFGWLHADMDGGLGIVRVVSTSVLGLACGLARAFTGSLLPPVLLHVCYNLIALGTMRGWWTFADWPTKYGIPTILGPISGVAFGLLLVERLGAVFRRKSAT